MTSSLGINYSPHGFTTVPRIGAVDRVLPCSAAGWARSPCAWGRLPAAQDALSYHPAAAAHGPVSGILMTNNTFIHPPAHNPKGLWPQTGPAEAPPAHDHWQEWQALL
jgi:hypothetical protein